MKTFYQRKKKKDYHKVKNVKVKATIRHRCSLCQLYFYLYSNVSAMLGKIREGKILSQIHITLLKVTYLFAYQRMSTNKAY